MNHDISHFIHIYWFIPSFGTAIIICAMLEKEIYMSGFLESILNFQGSNGYPTTKNKNTEILIVVQLVLLGHNIQQVKVVLVRLLLDDANSLEPFLISSYPSYVECLDLNRIQDRTWLFFIEYRTGLLVLLCEYPVFNHMQEGQQNGQFLIQFG